MRTTQKLNELERWMHPSRAEAQGEVKGLLEAWIGRVRPPQEAMVELPALVLGGPEPPAECNVHELLLVCHLAASVMHLVDGRSEGEPPAETEGACPAVVPAGHVAHA